MRTWHCSKKCRCSRKAEIYLDWPSDRLHVFGKQTDIFYDPMVNTSTLGMFDFDCDTKSNRASSENPTTTLNSNGRRLIIDWHSARDHILTIGFCFEVTHISWMEVVRQWASGSTLDPTAM